MTPLEEHRRRSRVDFSESRPAVRAKAPVSGREVQRALSQEDEALLNALLASEQDFIDSPAFYEDDAEKKIYGETPELPDGKSRPAQDGTALITLTEAQQKVLFLRYNYARYRIWKLQQEIWATPSRMPAPAQADEILSWHRAAESARDFLIRGNIVLGISMAERMRNCGIDYVRLVRAASEVLPRAVDRFDVGRGYAFRAFAGRAMLKRFARLWFHQQRRALALPECDPL